MGTAQLVFEGVVLPEVTGSDVSHVTGSGPDRKRPCPEVCSAHEQPEVPPYPPLFTGSDVSHVTSHMTG